MAGGSSTIPWSFQLRVARPPAPWGAREARPGAAFGSAAGLRAHGWPARLRRALAEDRFALHYQPIVWLQDGRLAHHEALLRLADGPGLITPASFLATAERHGLIAEIDRMVLARVARALARDPGPQRPGVAVNLSAASVTDPAMLVRIERQLRRYEIDPARLVIEVTETAAISSMRRARAFCAGVQSLGAAIALDDFGAGFSSLQYLKHLPFDYLKIDGEFIRGLPRSRTDQLVVTALVGLARGLGRLTIAEFVGDEETLDALAGLGVDLAQGYHVGRPSSELALAA